MSDNLTKLPFSCAGSGPYVSGYMIRSDKWYRWPALILLHEWWGSNAHTEDVARCYAVEGFMVFVPDLYDGEVTDDPEQASMMMSRLWEPQVIDQLKGVVSEIRQNWPYEVTSLGVTGFCMGGSYALKLACSTKVDAVVPFYGDIPEDTSMIANLNCPLLFIGAEKDDWITLEKMGWLRDALRQYERDGQVRIYPGVSHAFFNDTRPEVYSAADAADAWTTVLEFLKRHLREGSRV